MPCVETIPLRELDQLMRSVPNFSPRGHGVAILCKFEYNTKDCDCKYCLHHTGRGRKIRCGLDRCVCPRERIRAGAASYQEVISETMSAIHYPPFIRRLNHYLKESEEKPMDYRNEKHRTAFSAAIEKLNRKNYALMAAVYLLTADHRLWMAAKRYTERNEIHMNSIKLRDSTVNAYTLLCAAKDLYLGTKHLSVSDLADTELIPPKMFALLCNAMAIRRFGLGAIERKERTERV